MIHCSDLSFKYSGSNEFSLYKININIAEGECIVFTGKSGSGKTTLTRCINGLIPEFYQGEMTGVVTVNGEQVQGNSLWEKEPVCGSVFQDPRSQFFTTNTTSEVSFAMENYGVSPVEINRRIDEVFRRFRIYGLKDRSVFKLSSGEKQKIAVASAYALRPKILVMDEPSANLDIESTFEMGKLIKEMKRLGYTIIISEHRLYYLKEVADRIVHLDKGSIVWEATVREMKGYSSEYFAKKGLRAFSLDKIDDNFSQRSSVPTHKKNKLEVTEVDYYYKSDTPIIWNLSFSAESGEIIGIVGGNGEGKTTLVKMLAGLLEPKKGRILLNGKPVNAKELLNSTYFVMQDADYQLYAEAVDEEVLLGCPRGEPTVKRSEQVLKKLGLDELKQRHPGSLSGGQKQRVVIAAALMKDADILLMDEPTSGLDYINMISVAQILKEQADKGKIICIITHDYEFLKYCCTRVIQVKEGNIAIDFKSLTAEGFLTSMRGKEERNELSSSC
jgi:energy-coupling factor transporter ATP-binding protein EcfA2